MAARRSLILLATAAGCFVDLKSLPDDDTSSTVSSQTADTHASGSAATSITDDASTAGSTSVAEASGTAEVTSAGTSTVDSRLVRCEQCWSGYCGQTDGLCALGVFVTSTAYTPSFGGLEQADAECRQLAGSELFVAWLSTDDAPAAERVQLQDARLYALKTGTVVGEGWNSFIDGGLEHPIDSDQDGAPPPEPGNDQACPNQAAWTVWTGTQGSGEPGTDCEGWTSTTDTGLIGSAAQTTTGWTDQCNSSCDRVAALYCFETP